MYNKWPKVMLLMLFRPNVTKYKYILDNCMLPTLWQQSEEAPHVDVTVRRAHTFGHIV